MLTNPDDAVQLWKRATKAHFSLSDAEDASFKPLILLDTCEIAVNELHERLVHTSQHGTGSKYNVLEAFCLCMPSPYGTVTVGCNTGITCDSVVLTKVNVTVVPPLTPVPIWEYDAALKSWGKQVDEAVKPFIHWLAGGIPALLMTANRQLDPAPSFGCGSLFCFRNAFDGYLQRAGRFYPMDFLNVTMAYSCLLVSSTRLPISLKDVVPMPRTAQSTTSQHTFTFEDAVKQSVATLQRCKTGGETFLVVPPVFFPRDVPGTPIPVTKLHPFLRREVIEQLGISAPADRGILFEEAFVYAVYARYLLIWWTRGGRHKDKWVHLSDVLQGAVHSWNRNGAAGSGGDVTGLTDLEVNLSEGVHTESDTYAGAKNYALSWTRTTKNPNAHHDAYMWCRSVMNKKEEAPAAIQLRHGAAKTKFELKAQLRKCKRQAEKVACGADADACKATKSVGKPIKVAEAASMPFPLFVVTPQGDSYGDLPNHVSIDGRGICSELWPSLLTPGHSIAADSRHKPAKKK